LQPRHRPSTDSIHISVRQIAQIVRGSMPRTPVLVMIIIENAMPRPSVQANRFGLAETHSGGEPSVRARAMMPIGLYWIPAVTRMRNSTKNRVETTCSGR
jgi:hypothetical protein